MFVNQNGKFVNRNGKFVNRNGYRAFGMENYFPSIHTSMVHWECNESNLHKCWSDYNKLSRRIINISTLNTEKKFRCNFVIWGKFLEVIVILATQDLTTFKKGKVGR